MASSCGVYAQLPRSAENNGIDLIKRHIGVLSFGRGTLLCCSQRKYIKQRVVWGRTKARNGIRVQCRCTFMRAAAGIVSDKDVVCKTGYGGEIGFV